MKNIALVFLTTLAFVVLAGCAKKPEAPPPAPRPAVAPRPAARMVTAFVPKTAAEKAVAAAFEKKEPTRMIVNIRIMPPVPPSPAAKPAGGKAPTTQMFMVASVLKADKSKITSTHVIYNTVKKTATVQAMPAGRPMPPSMKPGMKPGAKMPAKPAAKTPAKGY